jgi:hypothetical protein
VQFGEAEEALAADLLALGQLGLFLEPARQRVGAGAEEFSDFRNTPLSEYLLVVGFERRIPGARHQVGGLEGELLQLLEAYRRKANGSSI